MWFSTVFVSWQCAALSRHTVRFFSQWARHTAVPAKGSHCPITPPIYCMPLHQTPMANLQTIRRTHQSPQQSGWKSLLQSVLQSLFFHVVIACFCLPELLWSMVIWGVLATAAHNRWSLWHTAVTCTGPPWSADHVALWQTESGRLAPSPWWLAPPSQARSCRTPFSFKRKRKLPFLKAFGSCDHEVMLQDYLSPTVCTYYLYEWCCKSCCLTKVRMKCRLAWKRSQTEMCKWKQKC